MSHADPTLPQGVTADVAERTAAVLVELYRAPDQPDVRHGATNFLVYQAVGTMMAAGAPEPHPAQTMVAVVMELLADGIGHCAATTHLRRMAHPLERDAPTRQ